MPTYQIKLIDNKPTFSKDGAPVHLKDLLASMQHGGAVKVLTPLESHTDRQRRWYKGVCLTGLSDWSGDTKDEWDLRLKAECNGNELLKKESILYADGQICTRLTIIDVGKRKMTQFIENILSLAITKDWPVTPPDPELRSKK
jgi:hypothetical protein